MSDPTANPAFPTSTENALSRVLEAAGMGTFVWDHRNNRYTASARANAIFGAGALAGSFEQFLASVHEEDRERVSEVGRTWTTPNVLESIEYRFVRADRGVRWIRVRGMGFSECGSAPSRLVGIVEDVTDRRRADAELAEGAKLLELSHDAILVRGADDRIVYWNRGATELYGFRSDEALGRSPHELLRTRFPSSEQDVMRSLREDRRWDGELVHRTRSGKTVTVRSRWAPELDGTGKIVRILETNTDVSAQKSAEAALRDLNLVLEERVQERTRQLREANQELESFSYSVSHDLKSPLRAVSGFATMLLESAEAKLESDEKRYLRVVQESAANMGRLIDDLLTFSRVGRVRFDISEIRMEDLVRSAWRTVAANATGALPDLRLGALPDTCGDPALLRQVLINLLGNAVKFSGRKERAVVEVGGELRGNEAVYWIRDNGVGFDMRYADMLFGVFQRLHEDDTFEGTGVGLAIVARVVHRHGGRVWATGAVDDGATFYFSLPVPEARRKSA